MYHEKTQSIQLDFTKKSKKEKQDISDLQEDDKKRQIEMAWQDRTTFNTIIEL